MSIAVPFPREQDPEKLVTAIRQLAEGRSNAVGEFTLVANSTTTTVAAVTCGAGSAVLAFPKTAEAAAELGNGTMFIGSIANGSFTVTHASNAQTTRTFRYVAIG
ncbi:MAG: hypothetical protein M5U07_15680 [Xanthobacteraceae bacterium]|nr:hypothetical protein [Xanthobacteraceae bacterium]